MNRDNSPQRPENKKHPYRRVIGSMQVLFLHPNFPAQFRHLAVLLAQNPNNRVVFGTKREEGSLPNVFKAIYRPLREARPETHHYTRPLENAVLQGQAVYRIAEQLKKQGFIPDLVFGHSGWGPTLFSKDIFPKARLFCYFEWFYHAHGTDADFDPAHPLSADDEARIRIKNAPILIDLASCDRGLSPTQWQRQQFPPEFQTKINVCHDGVDSQYFCPNPNAKLVLPTINLDLSEVSEIVTYVARGMEPYRGFPQFMTMLAILQKERPGCHGVIVGEERVAYGRSLPDGKSYKQLMLETLDLDLTRTHFTGSLPYRDYLQVLQASSAHVYLTFPFVLSWSMLEAMSVGCVLVGSDTPPVREVIVEGENGVLVDFFNPRAIADRVADILDHPQDYQSIRQRARETICDRYDLAKLLPQQVAWLQTESLSSQ